MDTDPTPLDNELNPAIHETPLWDEARKFLDQLLLMTGREDRLAKTPFVEESQRPGIQAIWMQLRDAEKNKMPPGARSDLFNRLLLTLSIMTTSAEFFSTVFKGIDFADIKAVEKRVNSFRILCMLEYGNFRFGYKALRREEEIGTIWIRYFPTEALARDHVETFRTRPAPVGLLNIEAHELFALGNLASEPSESINSARKDLARIFQQAIASDVNDFRELKEVATSLGFTKLTDLIARAGVPAEDLVRSVPAVTEKPGSYSNILKKLQLSCISLDRKAIEKIKTNGLQNARTYMAMHDLNVYVATSMREPLHFTTNWAFVHGLFHTGELADWNLRYFDPTQAFLPDRIQTGLMECLMIKRAQLTVYHAQESDTFGKDSEAGVTLAQAKPVVVFVTRLFERDPDMRALYRVFDEPARDRRDDFVARLYEQGLLTEDEKQSLSPPEKSKADAIEAVVKNYACKMLQRTSEDEIEMELIRQGYAPPADNLIEFAVSRIVSLERRALTFRDVHPLALQTSPMDGVARGVIVTRTVADTAKVVSGLLGNTLRYEIVNEDDNWLLVDTVTNSPVRVVTKDPILTSAFWSERWGNSDR